MTASVIREIWMRCTAPKRPCETANVEYKINHLKGQCVSIASIIFICSFFLYGIIEQRILLGTLCSFAVLGFLCLFNRHGHVQFTAVCVVILTQSVGFYLLVLNHETTGITVLLLSSIMCMIALPPYTTVIFTATILSIMMMYMVQMHQLMSTLMWTRIVTHTAFGVIEYVACFVVDTILIQANNLQSIVNEQKLLEHKNKLLEDEKDDIIRSLFLIRQAISQFENGNSAARVPLTEKNKLKDVSTIINILLSKQEKLYQKKHEADALEKYISDISAMLHMSETFRTKFDYGYTRTPVDKLIQVLKGKKLIKP